jgi:5-formyltetrahydrofolate cyclo-ligase
MRRLLAAPMLSVIAQVAVDRVRNLPEWQAASDVLLFAPLPEEPDVRPLFEPIPAHRRILVPRMHDKAEGEMEAVVASRPPPGAAWDGEPVREWNQRRYGIWTPVGPPFAPNRVRFALIPGLAFTRDGQRLGRGKGYYDRFLTKLAPDCFKCGIGYDFQLVDDLPTEPHDVPLDAVVTPSGVYRRTDWLPAK